MHGLYTLTLGGLVSWFQFVASEELDVNIKDSENPIKMKWGKEVNCAKFN